MKEEIKKIRDSIIKSRDRLDNAYEQAERIHWILLEEDVTEAVTDSAFSLTQGRLLQAAAHIDDAIEKLRLLRAAEPSDPAQGKNDSGRSA